MQLAFKSQLHQQEMFNSLRSKIRMVLKDTGEDYHYIGFVEYWNSHVETLMANRRTIEEKVKAELKERVKSEQPKPVKVIPVQKERNKYEDEEFAIDEPKPKKKMSEAEKASLLGDLRSFAKNFKFPS